MNEPRRPPAGWYDDPSGAHRSRWWDGARWTDGVSDGDGQVSQSPLSLDGAAAAWEARRDRRGAWSGGVALGAVGAAVLATLLSGVLATIGAEVNSVTSLALGGLGLYGGLFLTCVVVSRRHGSGDFVRDYGLAYGRGDWWRGAALSIGARVAAIVVSVVLVLVSEDLAGTNTSAFEDHQDSLGFLFAAAILAVVAAPFFEELFFRGLVQRALENSMPVPAALGVQGLLFGSAHLGGAEGWGNVGVVLATAAAGVVFGIAARRHHRLGPSMAAHAWFNALPVAILFATR